MLSWLYGQLAGVAYKHGILSHTVISVWFEHVKQSATLLAANAGMVCEASWLLIPVDMHDSIWTHKASALECTIKYYRLHLWLTKSFMSHRRLQTLPLTTQQRPVYEQ